MIRIHHRSLRAICVVMLLAHSADGCASTHHAPFTDATPVDRISGITLTQGTEIRFGHPGARIANDTLYAAGRHAELRVPTDSIASVSQSRLSVGRTLRLAFGLAMLVAVGEWIAAGAPQLFPQQ